jgi:hypothetical protein
VYENARDGPMYDRSLIFRVAGCHDRDAFRRAQILIAGASKNNLNFIGSDYVYAFLTYIFPETEFENLKLRRCAMRQTEKNRRVTMPGPGQGLLKGPAGLQIVLEKRAYRVFRLLLEPLGLP